MACDLDRLDLVLERELMDALHARGLVPEFARGALDGHGALEVRLQHEHELGLAREAGLGQHHRGGVEHEKLVQRPHVALRVEHLRDDDLGGGQIDERETYQRRDATALGDGADDLILRDRGCSRPRPT